MTMKYALFAAVGAVCVATGAAPLLTEDFEATARSLREKGWHLADAAGLAPESRDGSTCLKMACPHRKAYAEYFVPVEKGKMYRARAWVKCEDVKRDPASPQNRGAVLFCQFANADKGWVGGGTFPKGLHGTRAWTCLEVNYTATIPESVAYIQVMLGIEGVGTAWFDDVMVEEITEWDSPAVISPRDGKAVESLRPVLAWEAALPHESYRVELAADSEFRRAGTQSQLVWGGDTRPANPLGPG